MLPRRLAVDAGLVLGLAVATYVTSRGSFEAVFQAGPQAAGKFGGSGVWNGYLLLWWTATAVGTTALLVRHRFPLLALAGTAAMAYAHLVDPLISATPLDLAAPVALYSVAAAELRRWISYASLAAGLVVAVLPRLLHQIPVYFGPWRGLSLIPAVAMLLAWLVGDRERTRHLYLHEATERAEDAERERDQAAELAAAAERARIARDLHDSVAHSLSIVVIQAQAAAGAMERRPDTARTALASIVATGRDSLSDMRRLLGLSRSGEPELAPLPGLADVPALVERVRMAGLHVRLDMPGVTPELPTAVGVSAYRIAQESLTTVLKHGGANAAVDMTIRCVDHSLQVTVRDHGRGSAAGAESVVGNGLRGMRERAAMLGGLLTAGNAEGGGFRVYAELPYTAEAPAR
jgi:signal transduction histidine kinase